MTTEDGFRVHRLRYEFNSIWLYIGADGYQDRHMANGNTLEIDFVLLRDAFIAENPLLTVVNKNELVRQVVRQPMVDDADILSPAIQMGIEFKMAHVTDAGGIGVGQSNQLQTSMLQDCRKLAHERAVRARLLAFIHEPFPPGAPTPGEICQACIDEYEQFFPAGSIQVSIRTPDNVVTMPNGDA